MGKSLPTSFWHQTIGIISVVIMMISLAACGGTSSTTQPSIAGTWQVSLQLTTPVSSSEASETISQISGCTMTISQVGSQLTSITIIYGKSVPMTGTINGSHVTLASDVFPGLNNVDRTDQLSFSGTVNGPLNQIQGTFTDKETDTVFHNTSSADGTWVGVKQ